MEPFLDQVARHYFSAGEVEDLCFIFPNRRAVAFFRKYLGECVARAGRPLRVPALYTMNDFFYRLAGARQTDQVHLLLKLYECYRPLYGEKAEPLDDFIFWGGVLLSDFDDVDKYLVDPERLFTNIADFRAMQDDFSWLDERQEEAIRAFLKHFSSGGRYKEEFRRIWDILLPLYRNFNASLRKKGMAYEGMVYRELAERLSGESVADLLPEAFGGVRKFVFVGLNALNECEKRLLRRLRDARLAEFCWDFSSEWIRAPHNKSSKFLSENVLEFRPAFDPDPDGLPGPEIHVLSVPSGVGQAKQIPAILDRMGAGGIETAIVLPDENLLLPVLNSLPERISDINVTMGYPMSGSALSTLMDDVAALQMHLREKDGQWYFYHKQVWSIFSNSIFKTVAGDAGKEKAAVVRKAARYYIPQSELNGLPLFDSIFQPVVKAPGEADARTVRALEDYQQALLGQLGVLLKDVPDMALEQDFVREYYLAVGRLRDCGLAVLPATYFRLLSKLLSAAAVPFRGEPLKGLQVMGPLETRVLDFDKLILLSCNEGMFPRRNVAASFIPAELRRGFNLPTYEYQDAVWAYYFYRMIQRAGEVWLLYDSRTEGVKSGEESRYIKQLELDFKAPVRRHVIHAGLRTPSTEEIPKTEEDLRILGEKKLSASLLKDYLRCPVSFYYKAVCGLKETEEINESLESNQLGNVLHGTMEKLYTVPGGILTRKYLKQLLEGGLIRDEVRQRIMRELNTFEIAGRNIIFEEMVIRFVRKIIERDIELLDGSGRDYLEILGLELTLETDICGHHFKGKLDRVDSVRPDQVRVVDYKTGLVKDADFQINEGNAGKVADAVFHAASGRERPEIALQLFIYDRLIAGEPLLRGRPVANSIYQPARLHTHPVETVELNDTFLSLMETELQIMLDEMFNPEIPFRRCKSSRGTCEYCPFKTLCGK